MKQCHSTAANFVRSYIFRAFPSTRSDAQMTLAKSHILFIRLLQAEVQLSDAKWKSASEIGLHMCPLVVPGLLRSYEARSCTFSGRSRTHRLCAREPTGLPTSTSYSPTFLTSHVEELLVRLRDIPSTSLVSSGLSLPCCAPPERGAVPFRDVHCFLRGIYRLYTVFVE